MVDSNQAPAADAGKAKTVGNDMDSRRVFYGSTRIADAAAYLNNCAETYSDFGDIALASPPGALTDEGELNPELFPDSMGVMVATLSEKGKGVKAIVVTPVPTLDAVLADEAAKLWLVDKVLNKELNHVAVRALRTAEDLSTVVDQMPTTLGAFVSSARESSGIMETFNTLYKGINDTMAKAIPVWGKQRFTKSDLKNAFSSAAYAREYYSGVENRGEGKDSLFVMALNLGIQGAKKKGLDSTIFERWLATRNEKAFTPGDEADEDSFDLDALSDALSADEPKADAPKEPEPAPAS